MTSHRWTQRPEDAAARSARHRDTALSALIAGAAVLALVLTTDERGLRPLLLVTLLAGGLSNAILIARRAGWRWEAARLQLIFTFVSTALTYIVVWATGH